MSFSTIYKFNYKTYLKILLHEMIHVWETIGKLDTFFMEYKNKISHGKRFKKKKYKLESKLGFKIPIEINLNNELNY